MRRSTDIRQLVGFGLGLRRSCATSKSREICRHAPVYEVGASLLAGAADCSDSAVCSAGGCSGTGSADGAACSSVGAGASGSATGCSVTLPSFSVIVSSFIGGEGFAASSSHACSVRTMEGDVEFGLDKARQSGWEARDNQDCELV